VPLCVGSRSDPPRNEASCRLSWQNSIRGPRPARRLTGSPCLNLSSAIGAGTLLSDTPLASVRPASPSPNAAIPGGHDLIVHATSLDLGSSRMTALAASRSPHVTGFAAASVARFISFGSAMGAEPLRSEPDQPDRLIEFVETPQRPVTCGLEVSHPELAGQSIDIGAPVAHATGASCLAARSLSTSRAVSSNIRASRVRSSARWQLDNRKSRCRNSLLGTHSSRGLGTRGGTHPRATATESMRRCRGPCRHLIRLSAAIG
jgi:hypothetical protein